MPHLGITVALGLALLCVAALVWFVHHVANSINVDTVIGLVHRKLSAAIAELEPADVREARDAGVTAPEGTPIRFEAGGYLRALDDEGLADRVAERGAVLSLRVRPGDYLFPGAIIGEISGGGTEEAEQAFVEAVAIGDRRAAAQDLEFAVRQFVEVGVRALSPGINDPFTALAVLDRLGAALCEVSGRRLPSPVLRRDGRPVLLRRVTDYNGLCDAMFHLLRQNAAGSAAVLIRLAETLQRVKDVERDPGRRAVLNRHLALALAAGHDTIQEPSALRDLNSCSATEPLS